MKTKKKDWLIETYYNVHDPMLTADETKKEEKVLLDKSWDAVDKYIRENIKKKSTRGPGGGFGWIEYWTLTKIKIYSIEPILQQVINYEISNNSK